MKKIISILLILLACSHLMAQINEYEKHLRVELEQNKNLTSKQINDAIANELKIIKKESLRTSNNSSDLAIVQTPLLANPCTNGGIDDANTSSFSTFGWQGFSASALGSTGYNSTQVFSGLLPSTVSIGFPSTTSCTSCSTCPGGAFGGSYIQPQASGTDALISALPTSVTGNSIRMGNSIQFRGAEIMSKSFVVPSGMSKFRFKYAMVCLPDNGVPGFFNAKAVSATGTIIDELNDIGSSINPNYLSVSVPYTAPPSCPWPTFGNSTLYYRPWHIAELDVSAYIGQQITIILINSDCFNFGHFNYVYLDDFCTIDNDTQEGFITLNSVDSCQKFPVSLNGTFGLPNIPGNPATAVGITLKFYQSGVLVGSKVVPSPIAPSYSASINASDFLPTYNGGCFDVVTELSFKIKDMGGVLQTVIKTSGTPANGFRPGPNNDICINCCNCQQTLNTYLFWTTGSGNAVNDHQLNLKCGDTLINKLDCFQAYLIKVNNPCGSNCVPDSVITKITYPLGGGTVTSYSLIGTTLIANQVGTYSVSIKVKCNGKWCTECKLTFKQTQKCEPTCDNCKDKVQAVFNASACSAVVGIHPAATTISASFLLGGGTDTYTQIRANIVDFNITSDNAACLQSYTTAHNWGSITSGTLGGFTPIITTYPGVSTTIGANNPREIIFSTPTPATIPMATPLNLTITIPGTNPLSCCCIKVVLFVKITYRNNKCEECSKIVRVALTECATGNTPSGGTGGGITFDTDLTGQPQYRIMHSPNSADAQILNQSQSSGSIKN